MKFRVLAVVALLLLMPLSSFAQPLADRLPGDALLYVGWRGTNSPGPAYEGSHLKAVFDATDLKHVCAEFVPQLIARLSRENPMVGQVYPVVATIGSALVRHPTALYVGKFDIQPGQMPQPRVALLCDAGTDAGELLGQISGLLGLLPPNPPVAASKDERGLVTVTIGKMSPEFQQTILGRVAGTNLATSNAFTAAMAQTQPDPTLAVYLDVRTLLSQVDEAMTAAPNADAKGQWAKVRDFLGLEGVRQLAIAAGFDGKEWSTSAFLGAPAPRKGLMAMLDSPPLADDALKVVPKTAIWAAAGKASMTRLFNAAREISAQAPGGLEQFDQGIQQLSLGFGLDIQKDVLAAFGDDWVFYTDPNTGGEGLLGFVVVNRLANSAKAEGTFVKVQELLFQILRANLHDAKVQIDMRETKSGDVTLHYLAVPFISPTWAVRDGNLYLGLSPQTASAGSDFVAGHGPSVLESDAFKAVTARLAEKAGGAKFTGVSFMDLQRSAPEGYAMWVAISRYAAVADMFGVASPAMLLPPLNKLLPHITPAGSAQWSDATGFHARSLTPFPGAELIASDPLGGVAFTGPLAASILLPSLSKARETANRVKCSANLRSIGQGCLLYANDNNGKYPPDLGTLAKGDYASPAVFVCPSGDTQVPADLRTAKPDEQSAWINAHTDYVYLGAGMKNTAGADTILCYEKSDNHKQGMNILFADGHVDFLLNAQAQQMIQQQAKPHP